MRRITLLAVAAVLVATACEGGVGIIDLDPGEELTEAITAQAHLAIEISGSGRAVAQDPLPGTVVAARNARIEVRFEPRAGPI